MSSTIGSTDTASFASTLLSQTYFCHCQLSFDLLPHMVYDMASDWSLCLQCLASNIDPIIENKVLETKFRYFILHL